MKWFYIIAAILVLIGMIFAIVSLFDVIVKILAAIAIIIAIGIPLLAAWSGYKIRRYILKKK